MFHGTQFNIKVDFKEKITERYPGGRKFTRGFADVLLEPQWAFTVLVILLI